MSLGVKFYCRTDYSNDQACMLMMFALAALVRYCMLLDWHGLYVFVFLTGLWSPVLCFFSAQINELSHVQIPIMLMPDDFKAYSKIKVDNHLFNK